MTRKRDAATRTLMNDNLLFRVRHFVYEQAVEHGSIPAREAIGAALNIGESETDGALAQLSELHHLALLPSGEIMMAQPFSAIPTAYVVSADQHTWWAPCLWDALGIAAMVGDDVRIRTSCADCNEGVILSVEGGAPAFPAEAIMHFVVPARDWWQDIVFT